MLLRWTVTAFAAFLLQPIVGLALLGRLDAPFDFPPEFMTLGPWPPVLPPIFGAFALGLVAAVAGGGTLGGLLIARRRRRTGTTRSSVPHIDAMTPHSRGEILGITLLAANAAISEEVFFRLYLPLLLAMLGLDPLLAFASVTLLFGLMHRYQGWVGILSTALLGAAFALAYCAGLGLGWPILLHLLINLNALLLRPFVAWLAGPRGD